MKHWPTKTLGDFVAKKSGSVDPSKFPDEIFELYSIPAFDGGNPEVRHGREIGSSKQIVEPNDVLLSRIVPHIRRAWVVGENRGKRLIASGEWIVSFTSHPPQVFAAFSGWRPVSCAVYANGIWGRRLPAPSKGFRGRQNLHTCTAPS
jgi:hypothetical protein